MTDETDILGRPPVMEPIEHPEPPVEVDDDWRGEHFWKVPRSPRGGAVRHLKTTKVNARRASVQSDLKALGLKA